MFKKSLIAAALIAAASATQAAPLLFDADGTGGESAFAVDQLDWLPSAVLAQNGNQAIANFLNGTGSTEFTVLSQFRLGSGLLDGIQVFSTSGKAYEITAVIGFTEEVTGAVAPGTNFLAPNGGAAFRYVDDGNSFVEIYFHEAKNADQLLGTGFNDGQLIFKSSVSTNAGSYTNSSLTPGLLDLAGENNWNGQLTLPGTGITENFVIDVLAPSVMNTDFFKNAPLLQFLVTNVSLNNPFVTTNPSYQFVDKDGNAVVVTSDAGVTSTLGPVNGALNCGAQGCVASGPDFIFSTDFNSSVTGTVPEPGALALTGLALGLLGFAGSRKKA